MFLSHPSRHCADKNIDAFFLRRKNNSCAAGNLQVLKRTHLQMNGHFLHRSTHLVSLPSTILSRYFLFGVQATGLVRAKHVSCSLRACVQFCRIVLLFSRLFSTRRETSKTREKRTVHVQRTTHHRTTRRTNQDKLRASTERD